jgi:nucleotide-binding universal stress UspA family protein
MFEKIFVALDDSVNRSLVFQDALTLAKSNHAALLLFHVLSTNERDRSPMTALIPYTYSATREELVRQYQEQRKQAEQRGLAELHSLAETAQASGIQVRYRQMVGDPSHLICQQAERWGADLLVVGRRGYSGLSEWWQGSVSNYVLHHATCTVLVVQSHCPTETARSQEAEARITNPSSS